jgi:adenylate kinase
MVDTWEKNKTVILLSSILTWAHTPPQYKKEPGEGEEQQEEPVEGEAKEEEAPEEESAEEEKEEGEPEEENKEQTEEPEKKKKVVAFKESQYFLRVPDPGYSSFKFLETLALSIGMGKPSGKPEEKKLSVYVLCTGLLYGNGEEMFYEYFKRAWLQNPSKLPYIGKGLNLVPTIHVIDLARLIKRVIQIRPKTKYIVAIDRSKKPTQRKIVTAISKAIGTGDVETRTVQILTKEKWMLPLQINVKIRPSEVFKDEPTPETEAELEAEVAEKRAQERKFRWHCELGITENISKLNLEYNSFRDLKPVKIFITAPPASGKSWLCEQ